MPTPPNWLDTRWLVPDSTMPTQSCMVCRSPWPLSSSANKTYWPASSCERIVWAVPDHCSVNFTGYQWHRGSSLKLKIATLTFKVLKFQQPAYMFDMIAPYIPPRSLRSSNKNLLIAPDIRSEMGRKSFSFAAPTIWNSLPQHIRSSDSLSVFRGLLKTFLYQKSLPP